MTNAIVSTGNALVREAGRLFKPHGLTAVQFNVLHLLSEVPNGLRPADLTTALVVDASSTTYVIDRMESLGWLSRIDDAQDRRSWRIVLTPAGRDLHRRVAPLYRAALQRTLGGISLTRVAQIAALLRTIQANADTAVDAVLAGDSEKIRAQVARR